MIKLFVMDVDGTLTDGKINIGANGELFKSFNVKDGYAIKRIHDCGCKTCILTSRYSSIVQNRSEELSIDFVIQGSNSKKESLLQIAKEYNFLPEEIGYIGDDINDIECMRFSGYSACPKDSITLVASVSKYVCKNNGGEGAVREFIDYLISKKLIVNIYDCWFIG